MKTCREVFRQVPQDFDLLIVLQSSCFLND
jgi:hypothetical protein